MSQVTSSQKYEVVIGLEVHLQLSTQTKIFCGCANLFGKDPNTLTCPVCLGLPGSLPVLNKRSVEYAIRIGLALNCKINPYVKFHRKNYYYPDLPKGYQISQYDLPIASDGYLMIPMSDGGQKRISITRAHMEEDAGKLIHDAKADDSLVDYNRTGTPLIEIVSGPDMRSAQEAYDYLQTLKLNLSYLDVSDCDMEKGSLRCDANISLRIFGAKELGTKTELKNMNSFSAVKKALEHEIHRQEKLLDAGEKIRQESRLWNEEKGMTIAMRSKEEAHDYRYFPEPDLVPCLISSEMIDATKKSLPELPSAKLDRLIKDYKLTEYDAKIMIQDQNLAAFFERCTKLYSEPKKICNWLSGSVLQILNERKISINDLPLTSEKLVELIKKVDDGIVSNLVAKDIFKEMIESGKSADTIIQEKGLTQVSDEGELEKIIITIMDENPNVVAQIKEGKESAAGFLVGQAMKRSQGKANPKKIGELIKRRLSNG